MALGKPLVMAGWCCVMILGASACKSLEQGAREEFSKEKSCPIQDVTSKERKDLDTYELIFGSPKPPPADVQNDPQRLAMWNKQQQEKHDSWNSDGALYEVSGCGHDIIYHCTHPGGRRGGSNSGSVMCSSVTKEPKVKTKTK